jgi:hypothetical protein
MQEIFFNDALQQSIIMETFIPAEDVLVKIKYHPDITPEEKAKFQEQIKGLYMTDKRKEQTFKKTLTNQQRNKKI